VRERERERDGKKEKISQKTERSRVKNGQKCSDSDISKVKEEKRLT
jgi:hypothetical protein